MLSVMRTGRVFGALLSLAACGGGSDNGTGNTGGGSISVAVGTGVTLTQGQSGTSGVTVGRSGSFSGSIDLSLEGAPAGVTGSFAPTSVPSGSTASTLTLQSAATTAAGTYTMTVRAKGSGVTDATTLVSLTVTAAVLGTYTLSVSPLSVQQSASGNATVTVTRTGGFAGAITLAVAGAPTGMTASVASQPGNGNSGTITVAPSAAVAAGNDTLVVTGTTTGLANQVASLAVTVTAASSGNVSFQFCGTDPEDIPVWVAAQDGNGAWTRLTAGTNNRYEFTIATRGGIAWVSRESDGTTTVSVDYGSAADLNGFGTSRCVNATTSNMTGTVAGLAAGESANISLGGAFAAVTTNGGIALREIPDGTRDLVATKVGFNQTTLRSEVTKMLIRRNVNIVNGGSLGTIDFGGAEAFDPEARNVTVTNAGSDTVSVSGVFLAAGGGSANLFFGLTSTGTPRAFYVPAARLVPGDFHGVAVSAFNATGSTSRGLQSYFRLPVDRTVTLPAAIGTTTFSYVATVPYVRPRAQQVLQSDYDRGFIASWFQSATAGLSRGTQIFVSSAYLDGAASWEATFPDFSGVAGWDNSWALRTGVVTIANVSVAGYPASVTNPAVDGGEVRIATRQQFVPNP